MKPIQDAPEDEQKWRKEMFNSLRDQIWSRQVSNSESYDRNLLSLSTAFLGLSLIYLNDINNYTTTIYKPMLALSWGLFALAVVCTIGSILTSQAGLARRLFDAEQYYIEGKDEFFNRPSIHASSTQWLNRMSAISFIMAIILTVAFVVVNFPGGFMAKNDKLERGAPVPSIQKVPGHSPAAGVEVPTMQKVPQTGGTQQGTGGSGNGSTGK